MVNKLGYVFLGIIIAAVLFFSLKGIFKISDKKDTNDYYVLTNQISKMNKLVVMEQDFSTLQKTSVSYEFLGNKVSENNIMTYTKTNAQVSYDLNKMKLDVDSIGKKLIIKSLPQADIRITPSVEIKSIDDSFFNRVDDEQIKSVTQKAKDHAIKTVDQKKLIEEGNKQLLENLNTIFVLAKALNYEIVDETGKINPNQL